MKKSTLAIVVVTGALLAGAVVATGLVSSGLGRSDAGPRAAVADELVTVTLSVPDMSCVSCPITVRKSLDRVDGVISAEASLDTKSAVVTFDPARLTVADLIRATTNVGYPSRLIK